MPDAGFSVRRMLGERALWILIACIVVFFSPALLGNTFFFRDLYLLFYGKKVLLAESLRHGEVPLWETLMHGGQPFAAEPANSALYPFNVLLLILPPLTAFNLLIVLQFVVCGMSAYFLGRAAGLSPAGAAATGVVYTFCGFVLSSANLLVLQQALAWAPALLASVHLLQRERRKRWLVGAVLFGALPLIAGSVEMAAVSFALAVAWMLVVEAEVPFARRITTAIVVVALSAGLSLVQTLPALEVIRNSARAEKHDYVNFIQWSVAPQRLPELAIPRFFGPTDTLARSDYWGWRYELGYPYIVSIYFGVATLLLAITGLTAAAPLAKRGRMLLSVFIAGGVFFSLGGWLPFFHFLYEYVPLIGIFRFPVKALQFALVPIALATGAGVDAMPRRWTTIAAAAAAMVLAVITIAFRGAVARALFDPLPPAASAEFARSFIHATIATALLAAACASKRKMAIVAVVLFDLAFAGSRVNAYAPRELFDRPLLADKVQALLPPGGRLYRTRDPYVRQIKAPSNENVWLAWWDVQLLSRYTAATFGIPIVFHDDYDGLAPIRITQMTEAVGKLGWPNRLNVLSAAGASAILTPDVIASADVERVDTLRSASGAPLFLYRNRASRPLRFATSAVVVRHDPDAFRMLATRFDPNVVILSDGNPLTAQHNDATLKTLHRTMNAWSAEVNTSQAGYVVFAETWYPGWQATVDGRHVPMLRADVSFSAVAVPAGRHIVAKTYRPPFVPAGLGGSVLTALILAFWPLRQ